MGNNYCRNYIELEQFSLLYDHFAFIDVPEYYADHLFIRHKVRVHFVREAVHDDHPYVVIFCKIKKTDRQAFLSALNDLYIKMMLCGYPGYEDFCRSFIEKFDRDDKPDQKRRCSTNEVRSA